MMVHKHVQTINVFLVLTSGFTPAHLAAQLEYLSIMKLLVHGKADINMPDGKSGRTPLHHSVETDDLSLAAYLILEVNFNLKL